MLAKQAIALKYAPELAAGQAVTHPLQRFMHPLRPGQPLTPVDRAVLMYCTFTLVHRAVAAKHGIPILVTNQVRPHGWRQP